MDTAGQHMDSVMILAFWLLLFLFSGAHTSASVIAMLLTYSKGIVPKFSSQIVPKNSVIICQQLMYGKNCVPILQEIVLLSFYRKN